MKGMNLKAKNLSLKSESEPESSKGFSLKVEVLSLKARNLSLKVIRESRVLSLKAAKGFSLKVEILSLKAESPSLSAEGMSLKGKNEPETK